MQTIWIASYPKSGNTWMRAFLMQLLWGESQNLTLADLATYFAGSSGRQWYDAAYEGPTSSLDEAALLHLRHKAIRLMARDTDGMVFVKTHSPLAAWGTRPDQHLIPPDLTRGAVYIVRNPLDIVPSAARHYGVGLDDMIDLMASEDFVSAGSESHVPEKIGSWSAHVNAWTAGTDKPLQPGDQVPQVVRYEDMVADPLAAFSLVTHYLGIQVPRARMNRAIRRASFSALQQDERHNGFSERSGHTEGFFTNGKPGAGLVDLSEKQILRIVKTHGETMRRCGYPTDQYGHG